MSTKTDAKLFMLPSIEEKEVEKEKLKNWIILNEYIHDKPIEVLLGLLKYEIAHKNRRHIVSRLVTRILGKLRAEVIKNTELLRG